MSSYKWRFFRVGGFDQVSIETGTDMLALQHLDQKLWAALSCPIKNLEFDYKTLQFVDSDRDGHIRVPEIIEAVTWAGSLLKNPDFLVKGKDGIPLVAINDETEEGKNLLDSARHILINLGKGNTETISVEDTDNEERIFAQMRFNGDGVIPVESASDDTVKALIADIIECQGAVTDRSGNPGVTQEKVEQFFNEAQTYSDWLAKIEEDLHILILGSDTKGAFESLNAVRDKVNDYFTRCSLARYDGHSAELLNPSDADYQNIAAQNLSLSTESFASFPIALVEQDRVLPLSDGINPAWYEAVKRFREDVVKPILGDKNILTLDEWDTICGKFAPYATWLSGKPDTPVEKLGIERIREILDGNNKSTIMELIERDKSFEPEAKAISSVDKLVRYCKYLHTLVNNFVAFRDFYGSKEKAVFQAGTLYLDGRSCELCVKVDDVDPHVGLASLSSVYLVYCNCTRSGGTETMIIAAAFTAGDSDQLMVGRNGVFYDRKGQDWDATITRIIEHPISIRQAFWTPYKRASRMVSEQLMRIAVARSKASEDKLAASAIQAGTQAGTGKTPAEKAFDVGKFAGIFAAIGLAVGFIVSAITSVITGFLRLMWWQWPIAIIGIMLFVSGPSMLMAWFKLRKRNLGPILDANGWAVNTRAKINIKFGTSLTGVAKLPEGAERSLTDPYADKKTPWGLYILVILLFVALFVFWKYGYLAVLVK
ncbi:MAG: hypothetical protein KBH82_09285 [Syntrophorhabdaceae bacterium]|nr:hypothetical protein [Syntrophorhabdaceae bacterium]MDI9560381.1 hypothetical protein [Pseudomonadota bacterium]HQI56212.1 hypothetical protein [Syntrophorhabdaceae bacterium]